jgi:hypothetical protein
VRQIGETVQLLSWSVAAGVLARVSTSNLRLDGPEHRSAQQRRVLQYPLDRILPLIQDRGIGEVHRDQLAQAVRVDVKKRMKVCGAAFDVASLMFTLTLVSALLTPLTDAAEARPIQTYSRPAFLV